VADLKAEGLLEGGKKGMVCLDVKIIIIDNDNYNREVTSNLFF